jgi:hypothetical protein
VYPLLGCTDSKRAAVLLGELEPHKARYGVVTMRVGGDVGGDVGEDTGGDTGGWRNFENLAWRTWRDYERLQNV